MVLGVSALSKALANSGVKIMANQKRTHHPYGMSRLNYWEECPGFQNKTEASDWALQAAEEGEVNHGRMEVILDRAFETHESLGKLDGQLLLSILSKFKEEEGIDDHDYSLLAFCCRALDPYLTRPGAPPEHLLQERKAVITDTDTGKEFIYGFYDLLVLYKKGRVGLVGDWKFGALPIPPADDNAQGAGYALAVLQNYPTMERCLVVFIQPKTGVVSQKLYTRADIPKLMERVRNAIGGSVYIDAHWGDLKMVLPMLNVSPYCRFCERNTGCPKLHTQVMWAGRRATTLTLPTSFKPDQIKTPQDAAVAAYLCNVLEDAMGPIRKRALEIARKSEGDEISFVSPDGKHVKFTVAHRGHDRVLGKAALVADALKNLMDPMEVLGAAKLSIGDLEKIGRNAIQLFAAANGEKITKREAGERLFSILEAQGLLSKPDGMIEYLRLERTKPKRLKQPKQKTK
jgi:hypothetical protein